ncbi:hypothetical protein [Rhodococcoides kyotonense]|uniref:Uncharacterized protein n=1 Tax=Rhodococcoides kyotonense TaxID=398843 RepID=A0A239M691_9NOCA|nr:hypothetical protein [Rhodococcus kyotonensis]SNT38121.1 hypothetical protein SAMN05421642_11644 [Rhodococcus kyotonensis]
MQFDAEPRHVTKLKCPHSTSRELLLIGLVVALGILVALAIVVPAIVTG